MIIGLWNNASCGIIAVLNVRAHGGVHLNVTAQLEAAGEGGDDAWGRDKAWGDA